MRHRKKFNHLSRKSAHRKAMMANMATSLVIHKRIHTTLAKAKALRVFVEPLITRSKEDTTHNRRMVFRHLQSKEAVAELFREVSVKVADRPGGYTRILKTGNRLGDNAEMCYIELVDFNELYLSETKKKTTRRSRRGSAKKSTGEAPKSTEALEKKTVAETTEVAEPADDEKLPEQVKVDETLTAEVDEMPEAEVMKTEETKEEEISDAVEEKPAEKNVEEEEKTKAEMPDQVKDESKKESEIPVAAEKDEVKAEETEEPAEEEKSVEDQGEDKDAEEGKTPKA